MRERVEHVEPSREAADKAADPVEVASLEFFDARRSRDVGDEVEERLGWSVDVAMASRKTGVRRTRSAYQRCQATLLLALVVLNG